MKAGYKSFPWDDAGINRLRLSRMTWDEIADHYGRPGEGSCFRQRAKVMHMECVRPTNQIQWTDERDDTIRRLRFAGASWDVIAAELRLSRHAVLNRADVIGAKRIEPPPRRIEGRAMFGAEPLPACHPWALAILAEAPGLDAVL